MEKSKSSIEGPAMRREVKTKRMVTDEMVLIVSPNHAWAARKAGAIAASLVQGVTLWIVVASLSLWAIYVGWIAL
jgi:hypothetical protein